MLTAVLLAVSLAGLWLVSWSTTMPYRSADAGGVLLTIVIVAPLAWRRQRPDLVLVISGTALLAYDAVGYRSGLAWLATFWAVYSYACHRRGDYAYWPLVVWVAEILAHLGLSAEGNTAQTVLIWLGVTAFVWIRGDAVRSGLIEAQRQREERARQAVADERTRIARELHDVVSQALGVIVMQAGGAGSVPSLREADAKAVLGTIEQTGRQAFAEMRRLVGVLRDDDEGAALAPQPTVREIPALIERLADAGLAVELQVEGKHRQVPAGAGVALRTWAILTLGRLFKFVVVIQAGHTVVASGPYRLLRHPSYTGGLVAFLGAGIVLDSWLSIIALVLTPLLAILIRIHVEEGKLASTLGPDYTSYASRTRRLVPGLW